MCRVQTLISNTTQSTPVRTRTVIHRTAKKEWSQEEINQLLECYTHLRPKWKEIAKFFPGRSAIDCKNKIRAMPDANKFDAMRKYDKKSSLTSIRPSQNQMYGAERERIFFHFLQQQYPADKNFEILQQKCLLNEHGEIVKDNGFYVSGRRLDFVVTQKQKGLPPTVHRIFEVTSPFASKQRQLEKEQAIIQEGGIFIQNGLGHLIDIGDKHSEVVRIALGQIDDRAIPKGEYSILDFVKD